MTSFEYEHSTTTTASAAAVWALWADTSTWPSWDEGMQNVTVDGDFAVGTSGTMTITGQPPIPFTLTEVEPNVRFADITEIPGATLRFTHTLTPTGEGTEISHRVSIEGPAAQDLGPVVTAGVPAALAKLAVLAAESSLV
jgi:uncharacterized protein YndB with AHSA1/START domain